MFELKEFTDIENDELTLRDYAQDIYDAQNIEKVKKSISDAKKIDVGFKIPKFLQEKYAEH